VRARIRAVLETLGAPLTGVSSAARGADDIFARTVLALGGSVIIVLPFPAQDFEQTSVGQGWKNSFYELLGADRVTVLPPLYHVLPPSEEERNRAFAECNEVIAKTARELSQRENADALFLAVYRRTSSDARGGTMDAFENWKRSGGRVEVIDPLA
jgi:hypothetical protein